MPETRSFTFVGQISPIRGYWSLAEPIVASIGSDSIGTGEISLHWAGSTVLGTLRLVGGSADLLTVRNEINQIVQMYLDAIGLTIGYALTCWIGELADDSGRLHAFDQFFDDLRDDSLDGIWAGECADVAGRHPLVRFALADYRHAIMSPADTAFYCYRALESLKKAYSDWSDFRSELGVEYEEIILIKSWADPRRHGDVIELGSSQRKAALLLTKACLIAHVERLRGLPQSIDNRTSFAKAAEPS